ncbi:serine/threonine protein kinase [Geminocystis sp. NIES-3708]|uniref:serine/threonine protein kinase n=1 Tax=Geminocystis sp. NIES-3708 TaxID=1615909 RepID=UPI0005FC9855|nr:serine/threonine-protein kinase [Geminocystis sp. NIES-3708]BAQ60493.1 serine/threonine protein kinase [Geminocystis sp. NIES-3708]
MFKPLSDLVKSFGKDSDNLLANRYQLITQIGRGAMGQVFKAIDKSSGDNIVAVKFLSQALLDEKMRHRFETEAKISALLGEQSNHIVKVKDYGLGNDQVPFYVMEYLEGDDLDHLVKKKSISIRRFLFLTRQICLGLECAHNGILVNGELAPIIHRDIKPSNIFLAKTADKEIIVKILDFGIAQIRNPEQGKTQESFMGTPEYCSPEQMAEDELHPTSDIYSLGVLMYQMLTQKTPITSEYRNFQAWYKAHQENIPQSLPSYLELPKDLENMIMRCLAKSPADRPQNIGEILKIITPLEREYNNKNALEKSSQLFTAKEQNINKILPLQQIYLQSNWPQDKPQKKIVFPCLTEAQEGSFSSLWTMLESQDIQIFKPQSTLCFNHFMYQLAPHPMILWVNLLYCRHHEPKWLPCYLDLKTEIGYQISTNLISKSLYYIILFEINKPKKYEQLLTVKISEEKIQHLQHFIIKSSSWQGKNQPELSKINLKKQFESVKNTILSAIYKSTK